MNESHAVSNLLPAPGLAIGQRVWTYGQDEQSNVVFMMPVYNRDILYMPCILANEVWYQNIAMTQASQTAAHSRQNMSGKINL